MTRHNNRAEMTVSEIVEDIKEKICDDYCKYTEEYLSKYKDPDDAQKRMLADKCNFCPLKLL